MVKAKVCEKGRLRTRDIQNATIASVCLAKIETAMLA